MNQVIKVYKQQVPAMKFVGKKYVGDDVYSHWENGLQMDGLIKSKKPWVV